MSTDNSGVFVNMFESVVSLFKNWITHYITCHLVHTWFSKFCTWGFIPKVPLEHFSDDWSTVYKCIHTSWPVTLNKQLPWTVVWASLPVQLSNTSVEMVWWEIVKQLRTTPLNSFKQGKLWQRPCIEIQHVLTSVLVIASVCLCLQAHNWLYYNLLLGSETQCLAQQILGCSITFLNELPVPTCPWPVTRWYYPLVPHEREAVY